MVEVHPFWTACRRLVRWWQFIGAREFGVYALFVLIHPTTFAASSLALLYGLGFFSLGVLGYWLNDSFDEVVDSSAHKSNAYGLCPRPFRPLITAGILGVVILSWSRQLQIAGVLPLLLAQLSLLLAYSMPPLRLKGRGWWGVIADAFYGSTIPAAMTILLFAPVLPHGSYIVALYLFLTFLRGMRSIMMHQIEDRRFDTVSNIRTVPVLYGPILPWNVVWRGIIPLESILIVVLAGLIAIHTATVSLIAVVLFGSFAIASELFVAARAGRLRAQYRWRYWFNIVYERWIPVAVILELLLRDLSYWPLGVALVLLFPTLGQNLWSDRAVALRFFQRCRRFCTVTA